MKKADLESIFSSASGSAENKGEVEPTAGPRQEEIPPKRYGRNVITLSFAASCW